MIERNIKDPAPTITASFRIIGRKESSNINYVDNTSHYDDSIEFEEEQDDQSEQNETNYEVKSISTDWNDESYASWSPRN